MKLLQIHQQQNLFGRYAKVVFRGKTTRTDFFHQLFCFFFYLLYRDQQFLYHFLFKLTVSIQHTIERKKELRFKLIIQTLARFLNKVKYQAFVFLLSNQTVTTVCHPPVCLFVVHRRESMFSVLQKKNQCQEERLVLWVGGVARVAWIVREVCLSSFFFTLHFFHFLITVLQYLGGQSSVSNFEKPCFYIFFRDIEM